ncbi:MAG: GTPase HflX, partial [Rhizobiales bacterium]|nr:GTPase HflX [Hyphomicrobiales bacterium]
MELSDRKSSQQASSPLSAGAAVAERAVVLGPYLRVQAGREPARGIRDGAGRTHAARLEEAVGLARAIDLDVVHSGVVSLSAITPATYLGKGKVEEIAGIVKAEEAGLVIVDTALSPVQQRNLEKTWNAKVLDRTGLILEIFGRRARTREGTLQVEHAHLTYQKGRLVRSWTHLERQRGGFGFLGGPGETQIEADRRAIEERLARIERELETVKRTRRLHRSGRKRVPYPIVALVGYTNAGKSTLFNRLTGGSVLEADMLFATLDPTLRAVKLPQGARVIISDTVGFISDLPTMLIAAFRATLEEVIEADIILHVRDISHSDTEAQARDVIGVLEGSGPHADEPHDAVGEHQEIGEREGGQPPPPDRDIDRRGIQQAPAQGEFGQDIGRRGGGAIQHLRRPPERDLRAGHRLVERLDHAAQVDRDQQQIQAIDA